MSEIDERIVSLQFDNGQFQREVSNTIKALDQLESRLQFNNATDCFRDVERASNASLYSLKTMGDVTESLGKKFDALQVIAVTALSNITTMAMNWGIKAANNFWDPIVNGGKRRSQNIAKARFQIEGLNADWDSVKKQVEYGVQDTAYGLDAAAKVASSLIASGVKVDSTMGSILRGISGVAAMTSSSYEEIGDIFTTVASNGKLMTMQLRQLSSRGLNVAATLAKSMNKTEAEINDMVSKGKISFQEFALAMDDAFGEHAKEANKTFDGALSNMKAALSRIGEAFATPVFDMAITVFNHLRDAINAVNKALNFNVATANNPITIWKQFTEYIASLTDALFKDGDILQIIVDLVVDLWTWIRPIIQALKETFWISQDGLSKMVKSMNGSLSQFQLYGEKATKVKDIFKSLFGIIKLIGVVGYNALKIMMPILSAIARVFGVTIDNSDSLTYNLNKIIPVLAAIANMLGDKIAKWLTIFLSSTDGIMKILSKLIPFLLNGILVISALIGPLVNWLLEIGSKILPIIISGAKVAFTVIALGVSALAGAITGVKNLLPSMVNYLGSGASKIASILKGLFGVSTAATKTIGSATQTLKNNEKERNKIGVGGVGKYSSQKQANLLVKNQTAALIQANEEANKEVEESTSKTIGIFDRVRRVLGIIGQGIAIACAVIIKGISVTASAIGKTFRGIGNFIVNAYHAIISVIKWVFEGLKSFVENTTLPQKIIIALVGGVIVALLNVTSAIRSLVSALAINVMVGLAMALEGFLGAFANVLKAGGLLIAAITAMVVVFSLIPKERLETVKEVIAFLVTAFEHIAKSLNALLTRVIGVLIIVEIVRVIEIFGSIVTRMNLTGKKSSIADGLEGIADILKNTAIVLATLVGALTYFLIIEKRFGSDRLNVAIERIKDLMNTIGQMMFVLGLLAALIGFMDKSMKQNQHQTFSFNLINMNKSTNAMAQILTSFALAFIALCSTIVIFTKLEAKYPDALQKAIHLIGVLMTGLAGLIVIIELLFSVLIRSNSFTDNDPDDYLKAITKVIKSLVRGVNSLLLALGLLVVGQIFAPEETNLAIMNLLTILAAVGVLLLEVVLIANAGRGADTAVKHVCGFLGTLSLLLLSLAGVMVIINLIDFSSWGASKWVALGAIVVALVGIVAAIGLLQANSKYISASSAVFVNSITVAIGMILLGMVALMSIAANVSFSGSSIAVISIMFAAVLLMFVSVAHFILWMRKNNKNFTENMLKFVRDTIMSIALVILALSTIIAAAALIKETKQVVAIGIAMGLLTGVFIAMNFLIRTIKSSGMTAGKAMGNFFKETFEGVAMMLLSLSVVLAASSVVQNDSALMALILGLGSVIAIVWLVGRLLTSVTKETTPDRIKSVSKLMLSIAAIFGAIGVVIIAASFIKSGYAIGGIIGAITMILIVFVMVEMLLTSVASITPARLTSVSGILLSMSALIGAIGISLGIIALTFNGAVIDASVVNTMLIFSGLIVILVSVVALLMSLPNMTQALGLMVGLSAVIMSIGLTLGIIGVAFKHGMSDTAFLQVNSLLGLLAIIAMVITLVATIATPDKTANYIALFGGISLLMLSLGASLGIIGAVFSNKRMSDKTVAQIQQLIVIMGLLSLIVIAISSIPTIAPGAFAVLSGIALMFLSMAAVIAAFGVATYLFAVATDVFVAAFDKLMNVSVENATAIATAFAIVAASMALLGIGATAGLAPIALLIIGVFALITSIGGIFEAFEDVTWDTIKTAFQLWCEDIAKSIEWLRGKMEDAGGMWSIFTAPGNWIYSLTHDDPDSLEERKHLKTAVKDYLTEGPPGWRDWVARTMGYNDWDEVSKHSAWDRLLGMRNEEDIRTVDPAEALAKFKDPTVSMTDAQMLVLSKGATREPYTAYTNISPDKPTYDDGLVRDSSGQVIGGDFSKYQANAETYFNNTLDKMDAISKYSNLLFNGIESNASDLASDMSTKANSITNIIKGSLGNTIGPLQALAANIAKVVSSSFATISSKIVNLFSGIQIGGTSTKTTSTTTKNAASGKYTNAAPTSTSKNLVKGTTSQLIDVTKMYYPTGDGTKSANNDGSDWRSIKKTENPLSSFGNGLANSAVNAANWLYEVSGGYLDFRSQAEKLSKYISSLTDLTNFDSKALLEKFGLGDMSDIVSNFFGGGTFDDLWNGYIDTSNILSSTPGGGTNDDYTSTLASDVGNSTSSAKASNGSKELGTDAAGTTNNYFTQNNYSPEPLARSEIYKQTQRQLNQWGGWVRSSNA